MSKLNRYRITGIELNEMREGAVHSATCKSGEWHRADEVQALLAEKDSLLKDARDLFVHIYMVDDTQDIGHESIKNLARKLNDSLGDRLV